jgi:ribosomal protein S18 acetylase RimI-like enzyme
MILKDINIEKISSHEAPIELLLLADPSRSMITEYLGQSTILTANLKKEVIGLIALYPIKEFMLEIKNLAVLPHYQNQGVGKFLIQHAENFARSKDFFSLRICTGNSSFSQLILYQKLGFHITGKVEKFFLNHYPEPIYENGILCSDLIILEKGITLS